MKKTLQKRILFASRDLSIGGMEKALITLLNNIDYELYDVTLVLESISGELLPLLDKHIHLKEYRVKKDGFPLFRKIYNFIMRLLFWLRDGKKYNFSCCYATYSNPCRVVALLASKNSMLYIHNDYFEIYNGNKDDVKNYFNSIHVKDYKTVAFVSIQSRNKMASVFPELEKKFITLGNLIDIETIKNMANDPNACIPESHNKTIFTFIGRIAEEQKRITRLIEAVNILNKKQKNFELWIIGAGPDTNICQNMVDKYKLNEIIKFLGQKTNPYPYMKNSNCIILSSDFEGFPVVYYEAAVLGLNIVTTIPAGDGFLDISEKTAIIAEKKPNSVAYAMEKILTKTFPPKNLCLDFHSNEQKLEKLYSIIEQI